MTEIKVNDTPFNGTIGGAIRIEAPEFTHMPQAGLIPYMARITIEYAPRKSTIDGDSLGEYFATFRDIKLSPEEAVQKICEELSSACEPMMMNVSSNYTARDGVATSPQARFVHPETQRGQGPRIQTR